MGLAKTTLTVVDEQMNFIKLGPNLGGKLAHRLHVADVELLVVQLAAADRDFGMLQVCLNRFPGIDWIAYTCTVACQREKKGII